MGKPITIDIPHQLGAAEARRRIDHGFAQLAQQITGPGVAQVRRAWDGDRMTFSMSALGQVIAGQLIVMDETVRMEVELPVFLMAVAKAIRTNVRKQGQILLQRR